MLAVLAEFERDLVSERTTAALAHKRRNGERTGGIPYGWRLEPDGTTLVAIDSEQAIIADIRAMRRTGKSYRAIADELTQRGVPTKQPRPDRGGGERPTARTGPAAGAASGHVGHLCRPGP